jgi:hypothetical protein
MFGLPAADKSLVFGVPASLGATASHHACQIQRWSAVFMNDLVHQVISAAGARLARSLRCGKTVKLSGAVKYDGASHHI